VSAAPSIPARYHGLAGGVALCLALALAGCSTARNVKYETVALEKTDREIPEQSRLDVGIVLFDPGVKDGQTEAVGSVFPEVRRAEARFMPYHLKNTLEASGQWGPVWVIPDKSPSLDLLVWGRVDKSDGLSAEVRVGAWDSTGREWLNKTYKTKVPEKAYSKLRDQSQDPYQNIYNSIANDLLAVRAKLAPKDIANIHTVAELRFGADLVPDAFTSYLARDRSGLYRVQRLPAEDDPMVARMRAVREREYTLVDTLNEYYGGLYYDLNEPYTEWRRMSREETIKEQELRNSARLREAMGLVALLGSIAYGVSGGSSGAVTIVGAMGGIEIMKSGFGKGAEADVHRESIKETGKSFEAEAQPLLVEVEGQTRRLTGNAEEKYKEWRQLLHEIYQKDTALPPPSDVASVATPSPTS
jgi:hypothetical protein